MTQGDGVGGVKKGGRMGGKYDDIIEHPHYRSKKRPHMSMINRAAQFSPFAALVGYDEAVAETGRLTDERINLDESVIEEINRRLAEIERRLPADPPYVTITYFAEDAFKEGGSYLQMTGKVKKMDLFGRTLTMDDGQSLRDDDIFDIEFMDG